MKRYLTVGIVFGILLLAVVAISWFFIPGWDSPSSGGFWVLVGFAAVGVLSFVKDLVSIWKDLKEEKEKAKEQQTPAPAPLQSVGSQQAEAIYNAPGGMIVVQPTPQPSVPVPQVPKSWHLKHPYPMPPNFTGRVDERKQLTGWLNDTEHPLLVMRALGGFGKSALAWHWLNHDVDKSKWTRVVWWSFYEGDSSFENFLSDTLEYLVGKENITFNSPRQQGEQLLGLLREEGILLVLDGFERALRAFSGMSAAYKGDEEQKVDKDARDRDCVSPAADDFLRGLVSLPDLKSKALMTTRLCPHILEQRGDLLSGCKEMELKAMSPADAVDFFWAQKIKGERAEIESACAPYGYHPLSLRLLSGLIKTDLKKPFDIAVADQFDVSGDLVQRQHHVLEQAYNGLSRERQQLLSRIACFRGAVEYDAIKAVADVPIGKKEEKGIGNLDATLHDFVTRGLLHHDTTHNRFDLHPIVRRYAYDRLTAPDRTAAHQRLADYFEAVPKPEKVEKLDDLAPVIELYHHMVRAGKFDEARVLFRDRLTDPLYFQFGAYQQIIELLVALFTDGENKPPCLKEESAQAWTLNMLANAYSLSGQPRRAVPLFLAGNEPDEKSGNKQGIAIGLGNAATQQLVIGALKEAERNLRRRIDLSREIEDEFREAVGHQELGHVLSYRGAWQEAETELDAAIAIKVWKENPQGYGINCVYRAMQHLQMAREAVVSRQSSEVSIQSAIESAKRALELANEFPRKKFSLERDYVRTYWLLGAAYRASRDLSQAERYLGEALRRDRAINMVDHEAAILLELAKLRHAQGASDEALRLASEALVITERSGYVLTGADVHLFLAALASKGEKLEVEKGMSNKECALLHAKEALRLATCDGPPDYTYKVAYKEAQAMLKELE
jgi:tetratricopeptide (TPR) repeat protein